ncbi:hypothetical protein KKC63_01535 [Patescibacteria group bacterium]|nr:hypothetical protein [Patescibacteria group bacterium]MBU4023391.1 hypothetical protein [Patescibacteria group bacterium]
MNRREKRRLEKLSSKKIDEAFDRLTKVEEARQEKKLKEKELVQEQLLAKFEQEAIENCSKSQTNKDDGFVKQTDSEFVRN